ncbi:S8 family serine peptidase [Virgibacillus halophilus]|uniref:S8 family serine peptidase n=1 Tax=Tigheibacillus halophilus TaxID=361280 RepID=A0ABU5C4H1_9BACI|nr:S8 family serine peptidase [Virgibacillus halophilus]
MCQSHFIQRLLVFFLCFWILSPITGYSHPERQDSKKQERETSVIIEVEGNAQAHKRYLQTYFPQTKVIAVYDTLFNGLAIKTKPNKLPRIASLDFVKAVHPVNTYQTNQHQDANYTSPSDRRKMTSELKDMLQADESAVLPSDINTTSYTGKGVKVGIIDTGVDYSHPDIQKNYQGGYDLVDLDDDPMETKPDQGEPTMHGTHVAGIIAADGDLKGVAPDASIYAYRALGPGGSGTSAQVIAALEQAVKDGVDIINLSLGNSVNGPDYPTSIAVNKASELGVLVVTANGNTGPENWTVGSPATAVKSFSVGASSNAQHVPVLVTKQDQKQIHMRLMLGSLPWDLDRDYAVTTDISRVRGKIALIKRGKTPFRELAQQAASNGAAAVLIYNNETGDFQGSVESNDRQDEPLQIPVAALSQRDGKVLADYSREQFPYVDTKVMETKAGIAAFSSRGPVTVNWQIKPNVSAPGTNIVSTVPDGYEALQGTSMAAPHVSGAAALLKEAHPDWSNEKIAAALETTANVYAENKKDHSCKCPGHGRNTT